jgi:alpha-1,2-glucosyltransferase
MGDKGAHTVVAHFAQIPYFFGFTAVFGWPHIFHFSIFLRILHLEARYFMYLIICGAGMWLAVHQFSYAHPYLLADNRHLSFYVWRRLLDIDVAGKNAHILIYTFSLFSFLATLNRRDFLFKFVFVLSVVALLAPTPLFEFRYFVLPFLIWRINILPNSLTTIAMEFAFNMFLNAVIFHLFLFCPFKWPNESALQRIMW